MCKLLGIPAPHDLQIQFIRIFWDLNQVRFDPQMDSTELMRAYIVHFQLDNSYWTVSKSAELYMNNIIREFMFFEFLRAIQVPLIRYGPCTCSPNGSVAQGTVNSKFSASYKSRLLRSSILTCRCC